MIFDKKMNPQGGGGEAAAILWGAAEGRALFFFFSKSHQKEFPGGSDLPSGTQTNKQRTPRGVAVTPGDIFEFFLSSF